MKPLWFIAWVLACGCGSQAGAPLRIELRAAQTLDFGSAQVFVFEGLAGSGDPLTCADLRLRHPLSRDDLALRASAFLSSEGGRLDLDAGEQLVLWLDVFAEEESTSTPIGHGCVENVSVKASASTPVEVMLEPANR